jgi:hypothetical protein
MSSSCLLGVLGPGSGFVVGGVRLRVEAAVQDADQTVAELTQGRVVAVPSANEDAHSSRQLTCGYRQAAASSDRASRLSRPGDERFGAVTCGSLVQEDRR